jgi:hypothetical protein
MKTFMKIFPVLIACGIISASAQSPNPPMVVVQAANTTPAQAAPPVVVTQDPNGLRTAVQSLEQMKAANADVLKKQEAALQQLEDIQKAADQLRIFSHRAGG